MGRADIERAIFAAKQWRRIQRNQHLYKRDGCNRNRPRWCFVCADHG